MACSSCGEDETAEMPWPIEFPTLTRADSKKDDALNKFLGFKSSALSTFKVFPAPKRAAYSGSRF